MALSPLADQIGRILRGRYRLVAPLGVGTSAQVFLADDLERGGRVAVKLLHPALADDERFVRRFRAEATTLAGLDHPHIVSVVDWNDEHEPFLVTSYHAGGSLRSMLDQCGTLAPSQALIVGLETCRGLRHAHGRGLVHRDIKPANILFDLDGTSRIADFGVARALADAGFTEPDGTLVGTARYASPEQAHGEPADARSDVYSLGLVLIEAVTGKVPFASDTTIGTLRARAETDVEVDEALGALRPALERAGCHDPSQRPDAEEFGIALLAASERMTAPDPLPLAPPDLTRPIEATAPAVPVDADVDDPAVVGDDGGARRRVPLPLAFALVALLALAGYVAYGLLRTPTHDVPELAGQSLESARLVADEFGWTIDEKAARRDGTEPGEVLSTDPAAGESLAEGETLVVIVSQGNELTALPEGLEGTRLSEAEASLDAVGLVATITREHSEDVARDLVIAVGEVPLQLAKGDDVPLVVSDGPVPREVPFFDGFKGYDHAAGLMSDLGLVPERELVFDDEFPAGVVLNTDPPGGATVERGSTVVLRVSRGPDLVTVPDMGGMTISEAESALVSVGLQLGQQCCNLRGRVITSDPSFGSKTRRGNSVTVFTGR